MGILDNIVLHDNEMKANSKTPCVGTYTPKNTYKYTVHNIELKDPIYSISASLGPLRLTYSNTQTLILLLEMIEEPPNRTSIQLPVAA